ncbi:V-type proton ATPase subunit E-like [Anneissia japonica]|uniref:V-type proton ATPase subunit E-like n=1 Tax=Anneissia japonica TaxID=1529436 RepID=UPI0014257B82|nr:V-type proton ATPase subunit E-like [Anneissia japonica]
MALNEEDVQKQIEHMMAFINQEAVEKADEIDTKAEEEFQIEKGRLVQNQRVKIMEYYERKEKNLELQRRIQQSNMLNQARLKVLKSREDHVDSLLEEARRRLDEVTLDQSRYSQILEGLLLQGLFQLLEPTVVVVCRQADVEIVESVIDKVAAKYKETAKKDVSVTVSKDQFLGPNVSGGVELLAQNNKIKVSNTLDSRLNQINQQMLPQIRTALFGANPNRKFLD